MQNDKIISVLIGLVGACSNNPKTDNTDSLVIEALAFPASGLSQEEITEKLRLEKNVISPGCATCTMPCGNTSDYDISRFYNAEKRVCCAKQQVITTICDTATHVYINKTLLTDSEIFMFYKALAYVSYDLTAEILDEFLQELQQITKKITEK
ncbi:MAG: hypothetical protein J1F66_03655 [Clostridiales bacterium]|nr:hypothetical protein [Clostridiales bacterium]